jgi:hypothetical protein
LRKAHVARAAAFLRPTKTHPSPLLKQNHQTQLQSAADAKDAATLVELRDKLDVAASHLAMVQAQQRRTAVGLRRAQLTLEELGALPDDAATYRAVGKA